MLERSGLISRPRRAQFRPCHLEPEALDDAVEWIERNRRIWTERFDRLDQHLREHPGTETVHHRRTHHRREPAMTESTETHQLDITRVFDAPREVVFRCMIEPEHLTHFWGPIGVSTPLAEHHDRAVGRRPLRDDHGERRDRRGVPEPGRVRRGGRAREARVDRARRSASRSTSTFTDLGDGRTEVHIHQSNLPEQFATPEAREGFNSSLDRFAAYLATL